MATQVVVSEYKHGIGGSFGVWKEQSICQLKKRLEKEMENKGKLMRELPLKG